MALLQDTIMASLIADAPNNLDRNEFRGKKYQALNYFIANQADSDSLISDSTLSKFQSNLVFEQAGGGRLRIPVRANNAGATVNTGVGITCTPSTSQTNVTAMVTTAAPVVYSFGIKEFSQSVLASNEFSDGTDQLRQELFKAFRTVNDTLNTAALAEIVLARNQLFDAPAVKKYAQVLDVYQVPLADRKTFFGSTESIFNQMDFYGDTDIISGYNLRPDIDFYEAQGAANSENLSYQPFNDGNRWFEGGDSLLPSATGEVLWAIKKGNAGVLSRVATNYLQGKSSDPSVERSTFVDPTTGLTYAWKLTKGCEVNGVWDEDSIQHEFAIEVGFITNYNSAPTTTYNPFLEFLLLNV